MALDANALSTLERARLWCKRSNVANPNDDELELRINIYSSAIADYCQREFLPKTPLLDASAPVARRFRYDGDGYLSLAPYELRAVGASVAPYGGTGYIDLYTDFPTGSQRRLAIQTVSAQAQYRLGPRNGTKQGTYLWLHLPRLTGQRDFDETGSMALGPAGTVLSTVRFDTEVTITGYWGAGIVPAAVEGACLISVANSFRNPEGFASRGIGELSFSEAPDFAPDQPGASLPKDARNLLLPYKRPHGPARNY